MGSILKENLRYYEDLKHMLDHFLIINIASKYGAYFHNEYLAKWRYIQTSYAHTSFKFNNGIIAFNNFKKKLLDKFILKNKINPKKFIGFFYISLFEMYLVDFLSNIRSATKDSSNKLLFILLFLLLKLILTPFIIFLKVRRRILLLKIRIYLTIWK